MSFYFSVQGKFTDFLPAGIGSADRYSSLVRKTTQSLLICLCSFHSDTRELDQEEEKKIATKVKNKLRKHLYHWKPIR